MGIIIADNIIKISSYKKYPSSCEKQVFFALGNPLIFTQENRSSLGVLIIWSADNISQKWLSANQFLILRGKRNFWNFKIK